MLGITAALNRPAEFRVHVQGALANGCTPEEIRGILLLVAMYCGIPAANDAHRIAYDVIKESAGAFPAHILAAGDYRVAAQHGERQFAGAFTVASGDSKLVKILMQ